MTARNLHSDLFFEDITGSYVTENPRFLRRDWLADDLKQALEKPDVRFVLLTAAPGAGKSTFVAQLAGDNPDWPRYFIRRDQRTPLGDVGASSFLLRIGYQLAALYPDLFRPEALEISVAQQVGESAATSEIVGARVQKLTASPFYQKVIQIRQSVERHEGTLIGLDVDDLVVETRLLDLQDLQYMALLDPAYTLLTEDPDARIVILVDALDEIRYHPGDSNLLAWLANSPPLPPNVRFVLTSRPDPSLQTFREKQAPYLVPLTIPPGDERVREDTLAYARKLARHPLVTEELAGREGGTDAFLKTAVAKAGGNLGYLDALARAIDGIAGTEGPAAREPLQELLALQELPDEIEGLYAFFLHQLKQNVARQRVEVEDPETGELYDKPAWPAVYSRILGVLAVARAPLALPQIWALGAVSVDRPYLTAAMERLSQFLEGSGDRYRLYHATLAEFLTAEATQQDPETADLFIDAARWHRRIANHYWRTGRDNWSRLDTYGLNHLAAHLYAGRQFEQLASLINQNWMTARFESSDYTYDGFLGDLSLAWEHAHRETHRKARGGEAPTAIVDCLRYALIQTTINGIAGNYLPELVVQALETGLWSPNRAMSVAGRIPIAKERVQMYVALLRTGRLGAEWDAKARERALASALASEDQYWLAHNIEAVAPYLEGKLAERALATILAIEHESSRAAPLTALAPQLEGNARAQALEEALKAALAMEDEEEEDWAWALADLTPLLAEEGLKRAWEAALDSEYMYWAAIPLAAIARHCKRETLDWALAAALDLDYEEVQAEALIALAPHLDNEALERALAVALDLEDDVFRVRALVALAPQLEGKAAVLAVEQALMAALTDELEWFREQALVALAPTLEGSSRDRALTAARAMEEPRERAAVLTSLAPQFEGAERQPVLEDGLQAALAIEVEWARAHAITNLAPFLEGPTLERALAAAQEISSSDERAAVLAALAPSLRGDRRAQALESAFDAALAASASDWASTQMLATVAAKLDDEAWERGMEAVLTLPDQEHRARALATLASQMGAEILEQGLETALALADHEAQAGALINLGSQLAGEKREIVLQWALDVTRSIRYGPSLARALAALVPLLEGAAVERGAEAALVIRDPAARAEALASLAPLLKGGAQTQVLEQALEALRAAPDGPLRTNTLISLAQQPGPEVLQEGLEIALSFADRENRVLALAAFLPQLSGDEREQVLERAWQAAQRVSDQRKRASALAHLMPYLENEARDRALDDVFEADWDLGRHLDLLAPDLVGDELERALTAAQAIDHEHYRADALATLAPQLSRELLERALAAALAIEDERYRAEALAALASHFTGEEQIRVLERGVDAAAAVADEWAQAQALKALVPHLAGDAGEQTLARVLAAALSLAHPGWRAQALNAILPLAPDRGLVLAELRTAVADHLFHQLADQGRRSVLADVTSALYSPPIFSQRILADMAASIVEVTTAWQWL